MRKALPILVAVLLLGAGVAIGWFASTRFSSTATGPSTSRQPGLAGEKYPAEKVPADWLYPGAKVGPSGGSSTLVVTGRLTVRFAVQETADDVPKVLKYYRDKLGIELPVTGERVGGVTKGGVDVEYCHVPLKPGATGGTATVSTSAECRSSVIVTLVSGTTRLVLVSARQMARRNRRIEREDRTARLN